MYSYMYHIAWIAFCWKRRRWKNKSFKIKSIGNDVIVNHPCWKINKRSSNGYLTNFFCMSFLTFLLSILRLDATKDFDLSFLHPLLLCVIYFYLPCWINKIQPTFFLFFFYIYYICRIKLNNPESIQF